MLRKMAARTIGNAAITEERSEVRRRDLVDVAADIARRRTRSDTRKQPTDCEQPQVGHGGHNHSSGHDETTVVDQNLLATEAIRKLADEKGSDHTTDDPGVNNDGPLELGMTRKHDARALGNRASIALLDVVEFVEVKLRGRPTVLQGQYEGEHGACVQDISGLDADASLDLFRLEHGAVDVRRRDLRVGGVHRRSGHGVVLGGH
ncbi:unnamed protein product [Phytophthora fragariaefolia]|uniref:Unnamed protein product n=1 Tax=Phytophthora fragariaefolia TaxID=1490495 RepID=A0A9W6YDI0_9STRA|nr:unnamed protein product [Phytophthora fragariaefolia]